MPIITATAERSFSIMKRVKTYVRSTIRRCLQRGSLFLQSNSYFDLNIGKVVDSFAVKEKRRLGFLFITSDDIYDQNRLLGTEEL